MRTLSNFGSTRHVLIVDALRYTLLLEQKAFTSMCRALRRIENDDDGTGHPNRALTLTALSAAWNIVDIIKAAARCATVGLDKSGIPPPI